MYAIHRQGKSLALICGAIRWLRDHEARELTDAEAAVQQLRSSGGGSAAASAAPDDWLAEQAEDRSRRQQLQLAEKQLETLERCRARATVRHGRRRPPEKVGVMEGHWSDDGSHSIHWW